MIQKLSEKYELLLTIYDGHEKIDVTMKDTNQEWQTRSAVNICVESVHQDLTEAKACYEVLKSSLPEAEIHMNNWYVDIVPKHISKAETIQYLIKHVLKEAEPEMIAIGDSYNDVCMFEISNHSYTFEDSPKSVKEAADFLVNHVYECISYELKEK